MWEVITDKIGDLLVLGSLGGLAAMWKKSLDVNKKFAALELDLAKNYVTKPELKSVEDKLDRLSETMTSKIDVVNSNIMLLLRTPNG